jgi:glutamyl-tRNA reductase
MPLVCLGLSHRTAPAEVRERHAFPDARASEALVALRDYEAVREASILSTCGRLEIYAEVIEPEAGVAQLKQFLTSFRHAGIAYDIEPYLYALHGRDAADQLLRVATGLDSMLIGEAEIICQVKSAYHIAQQAGSLGTTLHHLFAEAFTAAKAAHSRTSIGGASVSVATAAIGCAKAHVGTLDGKSVVLIGAGKMGQTAAKRLKVEGAVTLTVANRTHERAAELVTRLGTGRAVELESVDEVLATADVVIASTGAPTFVVTAAQVAHAMSLRPDRALCVIDIAVPRDVDPEVANIPGVRLVDIDELGATIDVTLERRRAAIPMVEEIIEVHLARFEAWNQLRATMPTIASLTQKAEAIRAAEVERLFARCPEIGPRERMLIAGMSMSVVSKLLHTPIAKIRQTAVSDRDEAFAQACAIAELFELRGDATAARESRRRELWNATAASAVSDD